MGIFVSKVKKNHLNPNRGSLSLYTNREIPPNRVPQWFNFTFEKNV